MTCEAVASILLIVPESRQIGGIIAALLLGTFLAALAIARIRHIEVSWACFGGDSDLDTVDFHSLLRTAMLWGLAIIALVAPAGGDYRQAAALAPLFALVVSLSSECARLYTDLRVRSTRLAESMGVRRVQPDADLASTADTAGVAA